MALPTPFQTETTCASHIQHAPVPTGDCCRGLCQRLSDASSFYESSRTYHLLSWAFLVGVTFAVLISLAIAGAYYVYSALRLYQPEREPLLPANTPQPRSSLLSSCFSSSATLYEPYQSASSSVYHSASHQHPPREPSKPTAQLSKAFFIQDDDDPVVLSPVGSPRQGLLDLGDPVQDLESPGIASDIVPLSRSDTLVHSNADADDYQAQTAGQRLAKSHSNLRSEDNPDDNTRVQPTPRPKRYLSWISVPRALTAPYSAIRQLSKSSTLLGSLNGLPSTQPVFVDVLGIGLSWEHVEGRHLPGPRQDMEWLEKLFFKQRDIRFNYLLDHAATYDAIHKQIRSMYRGATAETFLVFYFAGHGTEDNAFELYASGSLNEATLNEWIFEFRQETSKHVPVYVIFDFCREGSVERNTNLAEDVHIIWACSPLQSALDLRLPSKGGKDEDLPRSCFLIAMILAINDASQNSTILPWQYLATRMKELVMVMRGVQCYHRPRCKLPWYCCRCEDCLDGRLCTHTQHSDERHLFQVPSMGGLKDDPNFLAAVRFAASRFPLHIQQVTHRVSNNRWVMFFNPIHIVANKGSVMPRQLPRNDMHIVVPTTARHLTVPAGLDVL